MSRIFGINHSSAKRTPLTPSTDSQRRKEKKEYRERQVNFTLLLRPRGKIEGYVTCVVAPFNDWLTDPASWPAQARQDKPWDAPCINPRSWSILRGRATSEPFAILPLFRVRPLFPLLPGSRGNSCEGEASENAMGSPRLTPLLLDFMAWRRRKCVSGGRLSARSSAVTDSRAVASTGARFHPRSGKRGGSAPIDLSFATCERPRKG